MTTAKFTCYPQAESLQSSQVVTDGNQHARLLPKGFSAQRPFSKESQRQRRKMVVYFFVTGFCGGEFGVPDHQQLTIDGSKEQNAAGTEFSKEVIKE